MYNIHAYTFIYMHMYFFHLKCDKQQFIARTRALPAASLYTSIYIYICIYAHVYLSSEMCTHLYLLSEIYV